MRKLLLVALLVSCDTTPRDDADCEAWQDPDNDCTQVCSSRWDVPASADEGSCDDAILSACVLDDGECRFVD